jgi:HEPN/RES N-terminal domain 1
VRWVKELENEQFERRAAGVEGYVCDACFSDPALAAYVNDNATENKCDFCGRTGGRPIAAVADDVVGLIMDSIRTEWTDPVEELAYDCAEGATRAIKSNSTRCSPRSGNRSRATSSGKP